LIICCKRERMNVKNNHNCKFKTSQREVREVSMSIITIFIKKLKSAKQKSKDKLTFFILFISIS
jgi:hypothetical protein